MSIRNRRAWKSSAACAVFQGRHGHGWQRLWHQRWRGRDLLARAEAAEAAGLTPKFRILGYGHAGVRPVMGIGPIPRVRNLLKKVYVDDFDVIESNEAFASQALAVNKELGLDATKVNPNGGAIALGHPVGATGAIIMVKAMHELEATGGKRALCAMCRRRSGHRGGVRASVTLRPLAGSG